MATVFPWFRGPSRGELAARVAELEERAITSVPWDVGAMPSFQSVTQARALSLAPVFAANRHITDTVATLPLKAYRSVGNTRQQLERLPAMLRRLSDRGELVGWLGQVLSSLVLRGNAVGYVATFDGMGFPLDIVWLPMDEVTVDDRRQARPLWRFAGQQVPNERVVHIPWLTVPGRVMGLSPLEAFAATVTQGLDAQAYASGWFAAGGVPPGTFKNSEQKVAQAEAEAIKARLVNAIRTRQPIVYGRDWDYDAITIPPEQAQFVETAKLTANQIASIYGLAPDEVGGEAANSLTYSNEEHRQTNRLHNLRPWISRLEHSFTPLFPGRQYVRFNVDAVIRADLQTRHEIYRTDREIGLRSINEIRELEDLEPIDGGDTYTPLTTATAGARTP